jgi:large subunit ribosomal protein L25
MSEQANPQSVEAEIREGQGKGSARRLRAAGRLPAVVYSRHGSPLSISVDPKALREALLGESRFNTVLTLRINGKDGAQARQVMLKAHQTDPVESRLLHADFLEVRMDEKIRVEIPVILMGKPAGVVEGGILQQNRRFLEVLCFPNRIPQKIEVEVAHMKIGQSIHVADLKMPEGAELRYQTNFTIAVVSAPEKEEVVVAAPVAAEAGVAAPGAPAAPGAAGAAAPAAGAAPGAPAPAGGAKAAPAAKGGKSEGGDAKGKK